MDDLRALADQVEALTRLVGELAEERRLHVAQPAPRPPAIDVPYAPSMPRRHGERPSRPWVRSLIGGSIMLLLACCLGYGFWAFAVHNHEAEDFALKAIVLVAVLFLGCLTWYFPTVAVVTRLFWNVLRVR
jgi:hypothetical protein